MSIKDKMLRAPLMQYAFAPSLTVLEDYALWLQAQHDRFPGKTRLTCMLTPNSVQTAIHYQDPDLREPIMGSWYTAWDTLKKSQAPLGELQEGAERLFSQVGEALGNALLACPICGKDHKGHVCQADPLPNLQSKEN